MILKALTPVVALLLASLSASTSVTSSATAPQHRFVALDGDTVLVDGAPIRIVGFDAAELGPWAECWAEAALAGHARRQLQSVLGSTEQRGWRLSDVSAADPLGKRRARIVDREGYDLADDMVVYGFAARTDASWDWCGANANLHHVLEDEPPPHGPNLWWPSGQMFDARAAD